MEEEIWKEILEFPGYKLSDYGHVKSPKNKLIGNYYDVSISLSGVTYYMSKKVLLRKHFGENYQRKVWVLGDSLSKKRSISSLNRKQNKNQVNNREQLLEHLQNLAHLEDEHNWLNVEYYFTEHYNITLEQIFEHIANQINCKLCVELLDLETLTISWSRGDFVDITDEFLSFTLLRFYTRKVITHEQTGKICDKIFMGVYFEEIERMKRIMMNVLGINQNYLKIKYKETQLEVSKMDDLTKEKLLHSTKHAEATRNFSDKFFDKSGYDNETEYEETKLNYQNFTSNNSDVRLANRIYNLLPPEYKQMERTTNSFAKLNETFEMLLHTLYPMYTMSAILCEYSDYLSESYFVTFKHLKHEYQKTILKEIGK